MLCKRRSIRRCLALLLMLALPLCAAQAQDMTLPSAGARDQTVRVYLSRLNLTDRMDLTLVSAYSVHTQAGAQLPLSNLVQFSLNGTPQNGSAAQHLFNSAGETSAQSASLVFTVTDVPATLEVVSSGGAFIYTGATVNIFKVG